MIHPRRAQGPAAVAAHYDTLDPFYRDVWGEHVHHGYWRDGRETPAQAATALVELVADRLRLQPGQAVCDIGCGYGATALELAEAHGVAVHGVTLSAVQHARAANLRPARGALAFRAEDWLENSFPACSFDRAYAIESTEHMADKARCFAQAYRVLRPGGRLVICAWLAAPAPSTWAIRHLLEPICREGRLAGLGNAAEYAALLGDAGFVADAIEDLTAAIARTWSVCLRRLAAKLATDARYRRFLLHSGATDRVFAVTMVRLLLAFRTAAMRYAVITAAKPG